MQVLICGGGVIGASIAYFLSCRGVKATVIEGTGLACAASRKSGGFLALDWSDGSPSAGFCVARFGVARKCQVSQDPSRPATNRPALPPHQGEPDGLLTTSVLDRQRRGICVAS